MRAINLLPQSTGRSRRGRPSPWVFLAAAAPLVACGLVYLGYTTQHSTVVAKRGELRVVRAQFAKLPRVDQTVASDAGLLAERNQREAALNDALAKRMAWDLTLNDVARVLPKDVWLTGLTVQSPSPADAAAPAPAPVAATSSSSKTTTTTPAAPAPAAPASPQGFTLNGSALSEGDVADLIARLNLLPMLNNVTLLSTQSSAAAAGKPTFQFQIVASVNAAALAATS